jgi:acyl-CoA thioester hydrolase
MTVASPPTGILDGRVHQLPIRVYYEDTDAGGIVYHAAFLRFAERGRSEMLRLLGWPYERMLSDTGCGWAVRRLSADYLLPAKLDDALLVRTRLAAIGGASVEVAQIFLRGDTLIASIQLRLALVATTGRAVRLPSGLKSALCAFLESQESSPR